MTFVSRVLATTCSIFTSITVLGFLFAQPLLNQISLFDYSFSELFLSTTSYDLFMISLMTAIYTMAVDQTTKLSEEWKHVFSYFGTLLIVLVFSYMKGYIEFSFHYLAVISGTVLICYSAVWLLILIQSFKLSEEINRSLKKINH